MADKKTQTQNSNNAMALLSYLGILFIIPMLTSKDDPFVKFHIKQGLVLFIFELVLMFVNVIPILGQLVWLVGMITSLVLAITGIMNALAGTQKELPLIGKYAAKFNF